MEIVDRGSGPPLVLIPGIQGRWEYMRPAVDALAACFRVVTFSLDGTVRLQPDTTSEKAPHTTSEKAPDTACNGLDDYAAQVAAAMDAKGIERATICGVSFGGLIALRFAARYPARCEALVLASTPRPALRLRRRHQIYLRAPWVFGPVFLAESPFRLRPEIVVAIPDPRARLRFALHGLRTLVSAPVSLRGMASRAQLIIGADLAADCECITAPTLVVTGEARLDHVVPVEGSSEYTRRIPNARAVVLERTGHLGSITRPDAFTEIVRAFTAGVRVALDASRDRHPDRVA
jgi:pimeloyl-ACP methyl ester carboxylesterase